MLTRVIVKDLPQCQQVPASNLWGEQVAEKSVIRSVCEILRERVKSLDILTDEGPHSGKVVSGGTVMTHRERDERSRERVLS